jgi:hypothetical protein
MESSVALLIVVGYSEFKTIHAPAAAFAVTGFAATHALLLLSIRPWLTRWWLYAIGIVLLSFVTVIFIVLSIVTGESDRLYSQLEHLMLVLGACLNFFPLWVLWSLSGRVRIVIDMSNMPRAKVAADDEHVTARLILRKQKANEDEEDTDE